jgi:hypothetical protein
MRNPNLKFVRETRPTADGTVQSIYRSSDLLLAARWRAQDLIVANYQRLSECPRIRCRRLFAVTHGSQRYCSEKCQQAERLTRWRQQNPERAKLLAHQARERRHARAQDAAAAVS